MPGVCCIRLLAAAVAFGILLLVPSPTSGGQPQAASDIIPGRYIVVLKKTDSPAVVSARHGVQPRVQYRSALRGFAGKLSDEQVRRLHADPSVLSIEPDRVVTVDDAQLVPAGIDRADVDLSTAAMIDGIDDALDVDIAILDSGIDPIHPDLRVAGGIRFIGEDCAAGMWADDYGHGTHVGGTAAAIDNNIGVVGVAPGARLWAVKVLDYTGHGTLSCFIAAVDWITANVATIDVANMSLRVTPPSTALCQAIASSAAAGAVYAVSAGNNHTDAGSQSPADCADVLTVSAIADFDGEPGGLDPQTYEGSCTMTGDDVFACFSNYGPLVEIAAPGVNVYSTFPTQSGRWYYTMSGTSMSAPHVAGAAALDIVEHGKPTDAAGVAAVRERLIAAGTPQGGPGGFTGDPDSYPEPLLSVASAGAYDAAITAVTPPYVILPGDLAPVDVAVSYDATSSGTLSVSLIADGGVIIGSPQIVTLEPHASTTLSFTWDTTGLALGDYSLTATVSGPPGEIRPGNNILSATARVRLPEHDVAVTEVSIPDEVPEGGSVPVSVTATDTGTFSETFSVTLGASGGTISGSPQTLALEPGSSAVATFTWDTTDLSPGEYALTGTAVLEGDANPGNNSHSLVATIGGVTTRVSVSSAGDQGDGISDLNAVSSDGRYIAFRSQATNLVLGDTNGAHDVFMRDSQTSVTERVSVDSSGNEGDDASRVDPGAISADGRYVAFTSWASNLVLGDANGFSDIFVRDRQTGTTERVTTGSSGSYFASISADGRYVVFVSSYNVFVYDRQTGAKTNIGTITNGQRPAMSADGRYIGFASGASNLVPDDTNGKTDLFVRDRGTWAVERVSVDSSGGQSNDYSGDPAISADGRYLSFMSAASNLVSGDTNGVADIFVRDRQTGTTERVSVDSSGNQGLGDSKWWNAISADGRYVAFYSEANNLVPGDTNFTGDTFLRDRQAATTQRVSVDSAGNQTHIQGSSNYLTMSADGRFVAFQSYAMNLVPGDTNGQQDVFVRDRGAVGVEPPTPTPTPTPTPSPTPTPTPSPTPTPAGPADPVGGIAVLPELAESGSSSFGYIALSTLATAVVAALAGGAWYAKRRGLR